MICAMVLLLKGYSLLAWRYKTPVGEIDLVAKKGGQLVFVEVKARDHRAAGLEAVTFSAQERIIRAAAVFVQNKPVYAGRSMRFDVMVVTKGARFPYHLANAFGE